MFVRSFLIAGTIVLIGTCGAQAERLAGEALRGAISGRVVMLHTPVGSFPIRYREDGTMISQVSGSAAFYLGSPRDRGTWMVRDEKLCMRFQTWLDGRQSCYTIHQQGRIVHWRRDDGRTGTATISSR